MCRADFFFSWGSIGETPRLTLSMDLSSNPFENRNHFFLGGGTSALLGISVGHFFPVRVVQVLRPPVRDFKERWGILTLLQ